MKSIPVLLCILFSFASGYVLALDDNTNVCNDNQILSLAQQVVQEVVPSPLVQAADVSKISYDEELRDNRAVTIVFTLDETNKIHVLHVSGGYNLVTQYIKNSLEGKEIHSENAIPGINYLMTIKLPAAV